MRVFISWSGSLSQEVATALHTYLPCMIQGLTVFMSKHNLESGSRWSLELANELEACNFGILCLAPDNLQSPWLLFEAGALTKHLDGRACGLLLNELTPADIAGPLSQFQHRSFTVTDIRGLLRDINAKLSLPLELEQLELIFTKWWPDLERDYHRAIDQIGDQVKQGPIRDQRDILEEILVKVRSLESVSYSSSVLAINRQGDILSRPLGFDSLAWYTIKKFPGMPVSERWQNQLLADIDTQRYPTIREIDAAVEKARKAVTVYSKEANELFWCGTDFITKSLGFVDPEFRTRHPFREQTREAFSRLQHFIDSPVDV